MALCLSSLRCADKLASALEVITRVTVCKQTKRRTDGRESSQLQENEQRYKKGSTCSTRHYLRFECLLSTDKRSFVSVSDSSKRAATK